MAKLNYEFNANNGVKLALVAEPPALKNKEDSILFYKVMYKIQRSIGLSDDEQKMYEKLLDNMRPRLIIENKKQKVEFTLPQLDVAAFQQFMNNVINQFYVYAPTNKTQLLNQVIDEIGLTDAEKAQLEKDILETFNS